MNTKKIFSNLLLLFTFPIKLVKKSRIDNFVGGLLVGAIFSLVVNVITNQFQEMIQRQRILEAIENEMASNVVNADTLIEINKKEDEEKKLVNYFKISRDYSSDIWTQSSEPLQYVAQLDPEIQSAVNVYYDFSIGVANGWVNMANKQIGKYQDICFDENIEPVQSNLDRCLAQSKIIRDIENLAAEAMVDDGIELLQSFHPTKDRLNNRLLKLFMGDKSMKILSSE